MICNAELLTHRLGDQSPDVWPVTFWFAHALTKVGRADQAEAILKRCEAMAGELGLFAEEIDARRQIFLGNTPLFIRARRICFALFAKWPQPETAPTAPRRSDSRWTIQRLIRSTLQRQGLNLSPRGPGCYWLLRGGRRGRRCGRWRGYVEGQHPNPGLTLTNINRSPIALELYRTTALALKGRTLFSLPSGLSQRRPSPRWSASRGPPFTALSRQGGYAHILKGYFSFSAVLCG